MNLNNLKPLTTKEMENIKGGAFATALILTALTGLAIPIAKNLFESVQSDIVIPGGFKISWNKKDINNIKNLETKLAKLQKLYEDILPPFYEV